jgi:hypothetical protein
LWLLDECTEKGIKGVVIELIKMVDISLKFAPPGRAQSVANISLTL